MELAARPLLDRLWAVLQAAAVGTRTQYEGALPDWTTTHHQHRSSSTASAIVGSVAAASQQQHSSTSGTSAAAAGWHPYPGRPGPVLVSRAIFGAVEEEVAAGLDKYAAPPRHVNGLVLVGAATRMPCVRSFLEQVGCSRKGGALPLQPVQLRT